MYRGLNLELKKTTKGKEYREYREHAERGLKTGLAWQGMSDNLMRNNCRYT